MVGWAVVNSKFDLDGDGKPDLRVIKENGHGAYVSVRYLLKLLGIVASSLLGLLGLYVTL
jgi:hypothetical protein